MPARTVDDLRDGLRGVAAGLICVGTAVAVWGCDTCSKQSAAPPPAPSVLASGASHAQACAAGGAQIADPQLTSAFPRAIAGYCVDPNGETRRYGEGSQKPIDAICTEAFNGECEVYKGFGLRRVTMFRYVDGAGTGATVDVVVSQYGSVDGAYGMFTKRVIADGDPAREHAPREMKVAGAGALGTGIAYVWRAQALAELTYTNDKQTPEQLAATSADLLSKIASQIALPGSAEKPRAAQKLPTQDQIPLGVLFEPKGAFGVDGAGAGAVGYYQRGPKRYRILSITRDDEHQAADVLGSIAHRAGASKEKNLGDAAVRVPVGSDTQAVRAEWIVAHKGAQIWGVGDEESLLMTRAMGLSEWKQASLSKDEKLELLRDLMKGRP